MIHYFLIPIVAGIIGWVTNYLAVRMIFRPHRRINILGIKIQGLIPKRQNELAVRIAETIEQNLLSHQDIRKVLEDKDFQEEVLKVINQQVDTLITQKLSTIPFIQMFLQGDMVVQLKALFNEQLKASIPQIVDQLGEKIENKLDFKDVVKNKIVAFDLFTLESIILKISAKELKAIELLGGFLGFVIGLAEVGFILIMGQGNANF